MSDSTAATYKLLRQRFLGFTSAAGGQSIGTRLNNRLYVNNLPDVLMYPYGLMRLVNQGTSGAHRGNRKGTDLEVMLYGRPRGQAEDLELTADLFDQAMREWSDVSAGLLFCRSAQRDTLPPFQNPADLTVVMIRLMYGVVFWPRFLTQYDT